MSRILSGKGRWPVVLLAGAIFLVIAAGGMMNRGTAVAQTDQPVNYSHKTHIDAGMQCVYCHSSALNSPIAGVPSVQKCIGCHEVIAPDNEDVQVLTGYWDRGEPIPWVRVNKQPDFVYFSHQPHVGASLSCENCHGEVGTMDLAEPVLEMDMGWCLDCHKQQNADVAPHLWDCLVCHQ